MPYGPTSALAEAPYLREVLDALPGRKQVARLLWLPPSAAIGRHYDFDCSFGYGVVRLHVPVVSGEQVDFRIAGVRQRWAPGEVWYGDFGEEHEVVNRGDGARVHLVADVEVDDELLAAFPADFVERRAAEGITLRRPVRPLALDELEAFRCDLHVDGRLLPLLRHGPLFELLEGADVSVRPMNVVPGTGTDAPDMGPAALRVSFADGHAFALDPVGPNEFAVRGLGCGVTFELHTDATGVRTAELVTRAIPEDVVAARLGRWSPGPRPGVLRRPLETIGRSG